MMAVRIPRRRSDGAQWRPVFTLKIGEEGGAVWHDPDMPRRIRRRQRLQLAGELAILATAALIGLIVGVLL